MSQMVVYALCGGGGVIDRVLFGLESRLVKKTDIKVVTFIGDFLTAGIFCALLFLCAMFNNGKFEPFMLLGTVLGFLTADAAARLTRRPRRGRGKAGKSA